MSDVNNTKLVAHDWYVRLLKKKKKRHSIQSLKPVTIYKASSVKAWFAQAEKWPATSLNSFGINSNADCTPGFCA